MKKNPVTPYTCNEYREEMILLGLRTRLAQKDISSEERDKILAEIVEVEKKMGLD